MSAAKDEIYSILTGTQSGREILEGHSLEAEKMSAMTAKRDIFMMRWTDIFGAYERYERAY